MNESILICAFVSGIFADFARCCGEWVSFCNASMKSRAMAGLYNAARHDIATTSSSGGMMVHKCTNASPYDPRGLRHQTNTTGRYMWSEPLSICSIARSTSVLTCSSDHPSILVNRLMEKPSSPSARFLEANAARVRSFSSRGQEPSGHTSVRTRMSANPEIGRAHV